VRGEVGRTMLVIVGTVVTAAKLAAKTYGASAGEAGGGGGGLAPVQRRSLREGRTPGLAGNADLAPTRVRGQLAGVPGGGRNGIRPPGDSALYPNRTPAGNGGVRGETGTPRATSLGPTKGRPKT
jgi:hypothetical protein